MIVIGAGRIGGALCRRAAERNVTCVLVSRTAGWNAVNGRAGTAILIAVRNQDLADVVKRLPKRRHKDLVFVQNGMIRPLLVELGVEDATRGLLFVAVDKRGAPLEAGGCSPFTGPRADAVARWLQQLDIPAEVVSPKVFAALEVEKLVWNSAFGLLCELHGVDVATVCDKHIEQLRVLAIEMLAVGEAALGVVLDSDDLVHRLCAYSRTIPRYRASVKEWPWRNGWLLEEARRRKISTPVHMQLLVETGHLQ